MTQIKSQKRLFFFLQCVGYALGGAAVKSKSLASAIFINNLIAFASCRWANAITTMRLAGSALGVALVVFGPSCARADIVTYTATGTTGGVNPGLQGQFTTGQPWTYTFTLNTAVPDSDPSPSRRIVPECPRFQQRVDWLLSIFDGCRGCRRLRILAS